MELGEGKVVRKWIRPGIWVEMLAKAAMETYPPSEATETNTDLLGSKPVKKLMQVYVNLCRSM